METKIRLTPAPIAGKKSWRGAVAGLLLLVVATAAQALTPVTDGSPERAAFSAGVRRLFSNDEFELLERMADKIWVEKSRFTDGTWKLAEFFRAFELSSSERTRFDWDAAWARFARWRMQRPDSQVARVLQARMMVSWAWTARGGGYADTVPEQGWRDFSARLKQAREILEEEPVPRGQMGYYYAMMPIALGEAWPRAKMEKVFAGAVQLAPDFEAVYLGKATFLQPKWHGQPGDWQRFAAEAVELTRDRHGEAFYARVVWSVLGVNFRGQWAEQGIDWPRLKRGFEDLIKETPGSKWNLSAFCFYACRAGDRATAARLFDELGDAYAAGIWRSEKTYENFRAWAKQDVRP